MPKKKTRTLTSGFSCVTCDEYVEEHGVECQWCWWWEHPNCAGLTSSSVLSTLYYPHHLKNYVFCLLCYSKVPFALKIQNEAVNYQEKIDEKIKLIVGTAS